MDRSSSGFAAQPAAICYKYLTMFPRASPALMSSNSCSIPSSLITKKWFTIDIKEFYLGTPVSDARKFQINLCSTTSMTLFSTTTTCTSESKNACMDYLRLEVSANFGSLNTYAKTATFNLPTLHVSSVTSLVTSNSASLWTTSS
jgi:hypothetical protein